MPRIAHCVIRDNVQCANSLLNWLILEISDCVEQPRETERAGASCFSIEQPSQCRRLLGIKPWLEPRAASLRVSRDTGYADMLKNHVKLDGLRAALADALIQRGQGLLSVNENRVAAAAMTVRRY